MEMIVTRCVSTTKNASYIIVSTFLKSWSEKQALLFNVPMNDYNNDKHFVI